MGDLPRHDTDVVGHQHQRRPELAVQPAQQTVELLLRIHVYSDGGFVEQQQLRAAGQRPRDEDPLLLPGRQPADGAGPELQHAHGFQRVLGCRAVALTESASHSRDAGSPAEHHLQHTCGEPGVERGRLLRDIADPRPFPKDPHA